MTRKLSLFLICSFEVALILFFVVWSASAKPAFYYDESMRTPSSAERLEPMEKGRILDRIKNEKRKTIYSLTTLYRKELFYIVFHDHHVNCFSRGLNEAD